MAQRRHKVKKETKITRQTTKITTYFDLNNMFEMFAFYALALLLLQNYQNFDEDTPPSKIFRPDYIDYFYDYATRLLIIRIILLYFRII